MISTLTPGGTRPAGPQVDFGQNPVLALYEVTQAGGSTRAVYDGGSERKRHFGELKTPESLRLIDQFAEFPVPPRLLLTGGDPLLRPDLGEIIEHAVSRGLHVSVALPATPWLTAAAIRRLARAGVSRIAIDIDGADAATHDAIHRATGLFSRSWRALSEARQQGIATQATTTLRRANLDQLDALAKLLVRLNIALWSVRFPVPVGHREHQPRLSPLQYEQAFETLWALAQVQPYQISVTEAPQYHRYVIQHQLVRPPGADRFDRPPIYVSRSLNDGKGILFVGYTGLIHPGESLRIVCGLFPLVHVVRVYQQSPVFCSLRDGDLLQGKCQLCEFRHLCGGSRARAYAVTGNVLAQEPDCTYQPAALRHG